MLIYPHIDPVALQLGPLKVHWYGLMYMIGFALVWFLGSLRAEAKGFKKEEPGDILFYGALGVILGGRIGYVLFYKFQSFLADPLMLARVWEGGMSFHGGLIGVILAMAWYAHKTQRNFFTVADFIAPLVPPALLAGRIGNFINGELWGRPTDLPWGMVFPHVDQLARHPSMLYEALLEGVVMFALLWWFSSKPRPRMAISGMFLLLYGLFRFLVEQVREPDAHLGFIAANWLSMGMLLSLPMIIIGIAFIWMAYAREGRVVK
ncbi:MAG: prolipoprotein diacylglyceryl transferase [Halothiobacillaceae bacterium]|nr:prolipoprotein diacylglyceryl transferase [Halothiobacillaceae bacterium]